VLASEDAFDMTTYSLDRSQVQVGKVSARYFRENAAQAGLDLQQILPELITNADAAIAAADRTYGQIRVWFGEPDREFVRSWNVRLAGYEYRSRRRGSRSCGASITGLA
jgi:hypothetical protein